MQNHQSAQDTTGLTGRFQSTGLSNCVRARALRDAAAETLTEKRSIRVALVAIASDP